MSDYLRETLIFLIAVAWGFAGWMFADAGHNFIAGFCMLVVFLCTLRWI